MKFEIKRTVKFSKSFKKLAKKYRKLVYDYEKLIDILESGNHNAIKITTK